MQPKRFALSDAEKNNLLLNIRDLDKEIVRQFYDQLFKSYPRLQLDCFVSDYQGGKSLITEWSTRVINNIDSIDDIIPSRATLCLYRKIYGLDRSSYRNIALIFLSALKEKASSPFAFSCLSDWRKVALMLVAALEEESSPPLVPDRF